MKISSLVLIILFIFSGIFYYNLTVEKPEHTIIFVSRVIDGDTVETNESVRIRLMGVNTPETGHFWGKESTEFLENMISNRGVELESFGKDRYGRTLGYLFFAGKNVNLEILKNGHGSLYYYGKDKYYNDMVLAEEFARINGLGIWKKSNVSHCISLVELKYTEPERLVLRNSCNMDLEFFIKDDATHIYKIKVNSNSLFEKEFSRIFNDDGDSLYAYDNDGLIEFYRY